MCVTITNFRGCGHSHMEKVPCKHTKKSLWCFGSGSTSKSKPCLQEHHVYSHGVCRTCHENQERQRREREARERRRNPRNRDSFFDVELNREFTALPHFTIEPPPPAVVRNIQPQPQQQPQPQPRQQPQTRSYCQVTRSNAISSRPRAGGPRLHHPVPLSPQRARFLDNSDDELQPPYPVARGRPDSYHEASLNAQVASLPRFAPSPAATGRPRKVAL
ncbi:hypothetical protein J7T55_008866 [Diaporthe amygdali]|uniref:uncharacterized protein n=1 Tax=Phomopsis amygdali TaxID=1214568 RepID=UPI0022FE9CAA|nr:uncharacterized protein J7T55_008866 [Diaporthe amygdali]KAJ0121699.1 hypothetical protein J7T55_008866 [Diaporthe amygdali]